jgi:hypothetical protein
VPTTPTEYDEGGDIVIGVPFTPITDPGWI